MLKRMKCPRCGGEAYQTLEEGRLMYNCTECGDHNYLKLAQQAYTRRRSKRNRNLRMYNEVKEEKH